MDPSTWRKIDYASLNAKQKENCNFHRIAAILSGYGVDCARLENDWDGADFLAIHQGDALRVQLKGRLTIDKKYIGKKLWIAWLSDGGCYLVRHRDLVRILGKRGVLDTRSWTDAGHYNMGRIPQDLIDQLEDYLL